MLLFPRMATNTQGNSFKENVLRVVAVIGLIAVLLLGAWGIIQLAFFIPTLFNKSDSTKVVETPKESVTVSVTSPVTSGQPLTLNWRHVGSTGQYNYALSYSCAAGLSMKAPTPTGSLQTVACDTPFNFTNASTSMVLVPTLTGSQAAVTFTVKANRLSDGVITSNGTAVATIVPAAKTTTTVKKPTTPTKTSTGTTYVSSGNRTNLFGYSDLRVQILSVTPTQGHTNVQFVIDNVGTNVASAGWSFSAALPLQTTYNFMSGPQQALYPGDKIIYTLGYNTPVNQNNTVCTLQYPNPNCPTGTYQYYNDPNYYGQNSYQNGIYGYPATVSITADPANQIPETNEVNNFATYSYQQY